MLSAFQRFANDESGATAVEYGLIAALVSVTTLGALHALGVSLAQTFGIISDELTAVALSAQS